MVVGALVAVYLPDSPVKAKRFTDAEKVAALLRTKENQRYVMRFTFCSVGRADVTKVERRIRASRETKSSKRLGTPTSGSSVSLQC